MHKIYNREFQIIDTKEKAYVLGLFYADGNIGSNDIQVRITLEEEDSNLLQDIAKYFPFFYFHSRPKALELGCYKRELQEDFISNGCYPRKSYESRDNLRIPYLSKELIPHFIRGYFDGDGGCTLSLKENTGKKTQKRVYIYSVSLNLLNDIKEILFNEDIKSHISMIDKNTVEKATMNVYKLTINTSSYRNFNAFLYKDASLFMERKKILFDKIIKETNFFIAKDTPNCKFCNSTRVVCDGWNYYKGKRQNYLCRDCGRHFSAPLNSNIQSEEDELLED